MRLLCAGRHCHQGAVDKRRSQNRESESNRPECDQLTAQDIWREEVSVEPEETDERKLKLEEFSPRLPDAYVHTYLLVVCCCPDTEPIFNVMLNEALMYAARTMHRIHLKYTHSLTTFRDAIYAHERQLLPYQSYHVVDSVLS